MSRQIIVVGVNHKTAPVEIRERLAFPEERLPQALTQLKNSVGLQECLILSTCNRVEIYGVLSELDGAIPRMYEFLNGHSRLDRGTLESSLYVHRQLDGIQHLFRVASGLDSMVLGESEIAGQVKDAYAIALQHGATGKVFNALFQKAFNAAKEVRAQTGLGRGATSVGSVTVELARKIFGQLADRRILLIGAGSMGELVLKHLMDRGARHVTVANRSLDHAVALAERYRGRAASFARYPEELMEADIVITATGAAAHLLTADQAAPLMKQRKQRPLFIIDIAVPRNIDPGVGRLENIYLYDIDDLQGVVAGHRVGREQSVEQSQAIVQRKAQLFMEWLDYANAVAVPAGDAREHARPHPS